MSWRDLAGVSMPEGIDDYDEVKHHAVKVSTELIDETISSSSLMAASTLPDGASPAVTSEEPPKKRRRTRWGNDQETETSGNTNPGTNTNTNTNPNGTENPSSSTTTGTTSSGSSTSPTPTPTTRRTRWGTTATVPSDAEGKDPTELALLKAKQAAEAVSAQLVSHLTPEQLRLQEIKREIETLQAMINAPEAYMKAIPPRDRSPSPPAVYDGEGKRINTRERRFKDKLTKQRNALVEEAQKYDPKFTVAGYKKERPSVKIMVPVDKYPDYNFTGIIIGPRGSTQQQMEKEFNCKISVRGKNASKDTKGVKRRTNPDDNEPMHVFITGENQEDVEKAAARIRELLVPVDEEHNEHKLRQLRELAELNGMTRDESRKAQLSGARGQPSKIMCNICGAPNHVSLDCPLRAKGASAADFEKRVDEEVADFAMRLSADGEMRALAKMNTSTSSGSIADPLQRNDASISTSTLGPQANGSMPLIPPPPPPPPHLAGASGVPAIPTSGPSGLPPQVSPGMGLGGMGMNVPNMPGISGMPGMPGMDYNIMGMDPSMMDPQAMAAMMASMDPAMLASMGIDPNMMMQTLMQMDPSTFAMSMGAMPGMDGMGYGWGMPPGIPSNPSSTTVIPSTAAPADFVRPPPPPAPGASLSSPAASSSPSSSSSTTSPSLPS